MKAGEDTGEKNGKLPEGSNVTNDGGSRRNGVGEKKVKGASPSRKGKRRKGKKERKFLGEEGARKGSLEKKKNVSVNSKER